MNFVPQAIGEAIACALDEDGFRRLETSQIPIPPAFYHKSTGKMLEFTQSLFGRPGFPTRPRGRDLPEPPQIGTLRQPTRYGFNDRLPRR